MPDFFDLPAELRLQVYEHALCDVTRQPEHPWEQAPPCSSYSTFVLLVTVGHPLSQEVKIWFRTKYASRVYFYFDDVLRMHDFKQCVSRHSELQDLRFSFKISRAFHHHNCDYHADGPDIPEDMQRMQSLKEGVVGRLILSQSGYREDWWRHYTRESIKLSSRLRTLEEYTRMPPHGLDVRRGASVRLLGMERSVNYLAIDFPQSIDGMGLTFYETQLNAGQAQHQTNFCQPYTLQRITELRGKLKDLNFKSLDLDLLRAEIYHIEDSPWRRAESPWRRVRSPDSDEDERLEMDADSWGVPDEEEFASAPETGADGPDEA